MKKLVHVALVLSMLACFAASGFAQWEQTNWPGASSYFDLYTDQTSVIAQTWDVTNGGRTFLSSDDGGNWTQISVEDSSKAIISLVTLNNTVLAGTWNGLISATVGSTDWTALTPTGIPETNPVTALSLVNTTLYAGALGAIYSSTDDGASWTEVSTGIPAEARINSFATIGTAVFAGSDANGIYLSTDAGTNWTDISTGLGDLHIDQLVTIDDKIFALTLKDGVYVSSDNGTSWTQLTLQGIICMAAVNSDLYAGTDTQGMYKSIDGGTSWMLVNTGMEATTRIISLAATGDNLIAGTSDGVWRSEIESIVLPVEDDNAPEPYVLERNFPNPFNPTTTIGFSIPVYENVTLTIYNITGQKIRTLIDAPLTSGAHQVVWDGMTDTGVKAPTGAYLYELRAGTYRDAKKLLMMK